jgi:hypothetical protein
MCNILSGIRPTILGELQLTELTVCWRNIYVLINWQSEKASLSNNACECRKKSKSNLATKKIIEITFAYRNITNASLYWVYSSMQHGGTKCICCWRHLLAKAWNKKCAKRSAAFKQWSRISTYISIPHRTAHRTTDVHLIEPTELWRTITGPCCISCVYIWDQPQSEVSL